MSKVKYESDKVVGAFLGVAVGDAVGVPFEFRSREMMKVDPAVEMVGNGTYDQPKGTWSDDSSLSFCLAESLFEGYSLKGISEKFIQWRNESYWSARGEVFDVGITTDKAISRLEKIIASGEFEKLYSLKNDADEYDNGNGSLMRILPLLFHIKGKPIEKQFKIVWEVSALTHRHIRAAMSCLVYLKLAEGIINGLSKGKAYRLMQKEVLEFWEVIGFSSEERVHFKRIIQNDIRNLNEDDLRSGGYVIEVLESSVWFFLKKNNYKETILSIINLGDDTDTSAAIAGGLAGLYYGEMGVPSIWTGSLARAKDIKKLAFKVYDKYQV